jgi:hypothetical protein
MEPPPPTEADLQARLDAARMRLHVILGMKMPEETLKGLREAEAFRREQVRCFFESSSALDTAPS